MSSATVAGGAGSDGDATPAGAPLGLMSQVCFPASGPLPLCNSAPMPLLYAVQFLAAVAKEDFDVAIRIANESMVVAVLSRVFFGVLPRSAFAIL